MTSPTERKKNAKPTKGQSGNVLFYILIAVALVGLLTFAVSQMQPGDPSTTNKMSMDEQIQRLFVYTATVGATINQMVAGGIPAETFYSQLDKTQPGTGSFDTAPYQTKIYHPYGGGLTPLFESAASTDTNRVAWQYNIHNGALIEGVGKTNAVVSDVVFVARISTLEQCQRINKLLYNDTTVPFMTAVAFNALFVAFNSPTPLLNINAAACAGCVGRAQRCVYTTNLSDDYGYYSALLPG